MFIPHLFSRIINPEDRTASLSLLRGMLWLPSCLFSAAASLQARSYSSGLLRSERLSAVVISVGGLTVGGAGKTPIVRYLARRLVDAGQRVVILSRGYRRQGHGLAVVSDGSAMRLDWRAAGDEPSLLASTLPGVPVIVGADRVAAGRAAIQEFGATVLLLDDGFQHRRLARDRDIVVLDSTTPFGNGRLFPAGPLREPIHALRRADAIILTRVNQGSGLDALRAQVQALTPTARLVESIYQPLRVRALADGSMHPIARLNGTRVVACSGIANPRSFEKTLEQTGVTLLRHVRFPDHHPFSSREIQSVIHTAAQTGADWVVTTEKDAVRLPVDADLSRMMVLEIDVKIVRGDEVWERLGDFGF